MDELRPLDFSVELHQKTVGFTGRQWLINEIDRWLAEGDAEKVFLLTGAPGVGKSSFFPAVFPDD